MDEKTDKLLETYKKQVKQLARNSYLQVKAAVRELNESKANPEDIATIKLHMIAMITSEHNLESNQ